MTTVMGDIGVALRARMTGSATASFAVYKLGRVWHMRYSDEAGSARGSGLTPQEAARKLAERLGL